MGYMSLAEAVILQSLEDLWDPQHCEESKEFFTGEGFKIYSGIAQLTSLKKYKLIHLAGGGKNGGSARVCRA